MRLAGRRGAEPAPSSLRGSCNPCMGPRLRDWGHAVVLSVALHRQGAPKILGQHRYMGTGAGTDMCTPGSCGKAGAAGSRQCAAQLQWTGGTSMPGLGCEGAANAYVTVCVGLRALQRWNAPWVPGELCYMGMGCTGAGTHACIVGYCTTRKAGAVGSVLLILSGVPVCQGWGALSGAGTPRRHRRPLRPGGV